MDDSDFRQNFGDLSGMVEAPISPPSTSRDTGISMSSPNRDYDPNYDPHESEEESEDELDKATEKFL